MACCSQAPNCSCSGPPRFTDLRPGDFPKTLAGRLICTADNVRDLYTRFGLRPYKVRIIRTRWTGGRRGQGEEFITHERPIRPTPLLADLGAISQIVNPIGLDEVGGVQLSEITGTFTDDDLRGLDSAGTPPEPDEQVFYEIEFPRSDGQPGERRRFFLGAAPMYQADQFQWIVRLERAHEGRDRRGDLR